MTTDRIFQKFHEHYILVVMLATRLFALAGGALAVYYVNLTFTLPAPMDRAFLASASMAVIFAFAATLALAGWETRWLRRAIRDLRHGRALDPATALRAGHEALTFPSRHTLNEAWLNPLVTVLPVDALLYWRFDAPGTLLAQIAIAWFLGISSVLLTTFFALEAAMPAAVRYLAERGVVLHFDAVPVSRLQFRLNVCFGLTIVVTALMIGALANQRALDIVCHPDRQMEAVSSLRRHTTFIMLVAISVGLLLSRMLASSVASRVALLLDAMKRVEAGQLSQRVKPAGNDEVDRLAHQFNAMVEHLAQNDNTIRDLNSNLEHKVQQRTRQLSTSRKSLKSLLRRSRRLHADRDQQTRELAAAYEELRAMQDKLVQSEKMSSLGLLVAGLAHEINNSINAVYNGIQPLSLAARRLGRLIDGALPAWEATGQVACREEIERHFARIFSLAGVIENGATRTARIIRDLKTFSHPGNEEYCEFDLHEALDMCLNLLSNQIKHRVTVRRDYGQITRVVGPAGQLNQVFMNLLNNAQQAIAGEGEIVLSTRQDGPWLSVSMRDTGAGIGSEIKDKIFDPFFTTKEPGVGTGLGLSLSYGIVRKLGGTIECSSQPGQGAEFVVRFPCRPAAPCPVAAAFLLGTQDAPVSGLGGATG